jgi:chemotaxis protein CheD
MKKIILGIGDVIVSEEPSVMQTVLGSCVAVCLWDKEKIFGGVNHYMLPKFMEGIKNPQYCGPESIDRLVDYFLKNGSIPSNIKAKVFGGGNVVKSLSGGFDIGSENVKVAKKKLMQYGIPIVRELTGGDSGMKILFYSETGKVFVKKLKCFSADDFQSNVGFSNKSTGDINNGR